MSTRRAGWIVVGVITALASLSACSEPSPRQSAETAGSSSSSDVADKQSDSSMSVSPVDTQATPRPSQTGGTEGAERSKPTDEEFATGAVLSVSVSPRRVEPNGSVEIAVECDAGLQQVLDRAEYGAVWIVQPEAVGGGARTTVLIGRDEWPIGSSSFTKQVDLRQLFGPGEIEVWASCQDEFSGRPGNVVTVDEYSEGPPWQAGEPTAWAIVSPGRYQVGQDLTVHAECTTRAAIGGGQVLFYDPGADGISWPIADLTLLHAVDVAASDYAVGPDAVRYTTTFELPPNVAGAPFVIAACTRGRGIDPPGRFESDASMPSQILVDPN